jgi:hypothetical protein
MVSIIVSGRVYALSRGTARWLASRLRAVYAGETTLDAHTAYQLAWELEDGLEGRRESPLELDLPHVEPVLTVIHSGRFPPSPALIALQDALRRLRLEED